MKNFMLLCGAMLAMGVMDQAAVKAADWYGASAYRWPVAQARPARYAAGVSNVNCANGRCTTGSCSAGNCPNGQCGQAGWFGSSYSQPNYPANWTSRNYWGTAARYPAASYSQPYRNQSTARRSYDAHWNGSRSVTGYNRPFQPIYNTNLSSPFFK